MFTQNFNTIIKLTMKPWLLGKKYELDTKLITKKMQALFW
jgi:hypothetical protein